MNIVSYFRIAKWPVRCMTETSLSVSEKGCPRSTNPPLGKSESSPPSHEMHRQAQYQYMEAGRNFNDRPTLHPFFANDTINIS